ncbi:MAG: cell division ATP-binding protein FtsE [Clostridiales bacterium]|nr:cell division ATP-binding protein FtsE [Clostridiales bacterium]
MIRFKNVTKIYDTGIKGLKNVSFSVEKGEFLFIVGPSGSGKSTLIKLILKEEEPQSGEILIDGQNIANVSHKNVPYLRRQIGVVFQDFRLLPNKTVYENVAFAMQITDATHREIKRNVPATLSMVGLHKKARSYPRQLSGGEQQRVALARAIVNRPPILLADEPTGNLDPDTSWEIMMLLSDVQKQGMTVLVATHAWDIVDNMKKRVIALKNGTILRDVKGGYEN